MQNWSIRNAAPDDISSIQELYRHYVEHTAITFEYDAPGPEELTQRMLHTQSRYPYLVLEVQGRVVGYAYAGPFKERAAYDWSCELSIYLDPSVTKQGFGKVLYSALEQRLQAMGILNLYACIACPEIEDEYLTRNSVDFHAHLGYRMVGTFYRCGYKFGRWYHMVWMEKLLSPAAVPPLLPWQKS